ncbi:hypothetical protein DFQ14_103104 [Halopolyspora algeriensis]|uniref:Uncharacterized protein n=1 Tax=Halopolyspora algeriensis TaxID=1500506 RepID=A0A368VT29_9ACTN|nr:hypothetical protein [Halopolyspora algeriensis]RCW45140.1 hypothetical protein DFQ14_103104 [Halopolyspora algeriensis]TQM53139.1 hypothetical protein FHU43_2520 [Halopolyspora algeriensis]
MSWAIMIVAFGLLWVIWKRKKASPWWLKASLVFIGGASLAETSLGAWLAARLTDIAGLIPAPNAYVIGGATLILLVLTIYDIGVDRKADKTSLICLTILPVLFLAGIGPLAEAGSGLSEAIAQVGANSIGRLIGG